MLTIIVLGESMLSSTHAVQLRWISKEQVLMLCFT
ncbi:hypothetical protein [Aliifodinibius sp. S!AR15-10]